MALLRNRAVRVCTEGVSGQASEVRERKRRLWSMRQEGEEIIIEV